MELTEQVRLKMRVYRNATPQQTEALREDDRYGSPYSFWERALHYDLITKNEYAAMERAYGSLWHYRGD